MMRTVLYVGVFCAMQGMAQLLFKWGSLSSSRWLWGFVGGNLFGFSSIWLLMLVYRTLNPNVTLGITTAGAFLCSQIALSVVFKSTITPIQWAGILAILAGVIALAAGAQGEAA